MQTHSVAFIGAEESLTSPGRDSARSSGSARLQPSSDTSGLGNKPQHKVSVIVDPHPFTTPHRDQILVQMWFKIGDWGLKCIKVNLSRFSDIMRSKSNPKNNLFY